MKLETTHDYGKLSVTNTAENVVTMERVQDISEQVRFWTSPHIKKNLKKRVEHGRRRQRRLTTLLQGKKIYASLFFIFCFLLYLHILSIIII